ncbi:hypothetical protein PAAG_08254 [Paracoccidioides lutzii Pb01]|uniref:Uncharacterized protein n=1 Tax=Paracoccidioides lutzii (strain ATCC MYA-826 / Pb01) TaxID=502779 RepID=C1HBW3_PARBA|nr:hypothetical protein PAAG_08254 [Paracoccidioides lutzii Pb01]EEH38527.2 hypothetical protein PAAG_08254 [Paracoccidioides lutzii Pb01]
MMIYVIWVNNPLCRFEQKPAGISRRQGETLNDATDNNGGNRNGTQDWKTGLSNGASFYGFDGFEPSLIPRCPALKQPPPLNRILTRQLRVLCPRMSPNKPSLGAPQSTP